LISAASRQALAHLSQVMILPFAFGAAAEANLAAAALVDIVHMHNTLEDPDIADNELADIGDAELADIALDDIGEIELADIAQEDTVDIALNTENIHLGMAKAVERRALAS
jgi:hypothetical protein